MSRRPTPESAVRVIRFTEQVARQCSRAGSRTADLLVCDAIANGTRRPTGRRGTRGGAIVRFERTIPVDFLPNTKRVAPDGRVVVLGELTRGGCFALRLLRPAPRRKNLR